MPAQTPEECDALFEKGMNAGDIEAVVALYEPDAVLVAAPGQVAAGTAAIREAIAGFVAMGPQFKLNPHTTMVAGDVAVMYNDWTGTIGPEGQRQEMAGKAIEICRRQADGTWKFVIDDPFARD